MPNCKSCNAEIKFIKLLSGNWNPVDPDLLYHQDNFQENVSVINKSGKLGKLSELGEGYISHFDTCPFASQHRKKK